MLQNNPTEQNIIDEIHSLSTNFDNLYSKTIQTNLSSTTAVSLNSNGNLQPGITGILPVSNGGTGGSDSNWQQLTDGSIFTGTIYYRKIGVLVEIYSSVLKLVSEVVSGTTTAVLLGTIPSNYKTNHPIRIPFASTQITGIIELNTSGQINLYKQRNTAMTTDMNFYFQCTYII